MNKLRLMVLLLMAAILFSSLFACIGDDDDDDNDAGVDDDDAADDDDDDAADDDAADDDAADDDAADDDAADDDAADDDAADDDDAAILYIPFDDYEPGSLPSPPWTYLWHGAAGMQVANTSEPGNRILFINGGWGADMYTSAEVLIDAGAAGDIRVSFDLNSNDGTYLEFIANCSTGPAAFLQFRFDDGVLAATTYINKNKAKDSVITCDSTIAFDTDYRIDVDLYADGTYDVFVNSESTFCMNMVNYYLAGDDYTSFKFAEGGDADMTGSMYVDNLYADYL